MPADSATLGVHLIACGPEGLARPGVRLLGFKAYNLARIARLGVPVPPAFVLGTDWCNAYHALGGHLPAHTREQVLIALRQLESASGSGFGSGRRPLLVSVRSGAPVSMPGMLETVLNVGLCEATVPGLLRLCGNPRLVWDSYRRLIECYAEVVANLDHRPFAEARQSAVSSAGVADVGQLDFRALRALARRELEIYADAAGREFPQSPIDQLEEALGAVFRSWNGAKAQVYREMHGIDASLGTAAIVQRMVFGNGGATSGAGVGFTRNPASGSAELYVDYLQNAQGEDVVSGRTPMDPRVTLDRLPAHVDVELAELATLLEHEFHDAQEFEFTVENGELYVLQTRDAKRTPLAELRIAVELAEAGLLGSAEARQRVARLSPDQLEFTCLARADHDVPLATGVPASVGVASGVAVCDPERAQQRVRAGQSVILVRNDVATNDIAALESASGLLAVHGARTAHAAVVARQLGKPCVVSCADLSIDSDRRTLCFGRRRVAEGDVITLDADTGNVYAGALALARKRPDALLKRLDALPA